MLQVIIISQQANQHGKAKLMFPTWSKTCILALTSSRCSGAEALMKIWMWSSGRCSAAACCSLRRGRIQCRELISLCITVYMWPNEVSSSSSKGIHHSRMRSCPAWSHSRTYFQDTGKNGENVLLYVWFFLCFLSALFPNSCTFCTDESALN